MLQKSWKILAKGEIIVEKTVGRTNSLSPTNRKEDETKHTSEIKIKKKKDEILTMTKQSEVFLCVDHNL